MSTTGRGSALREVNDRLSQLPAKDLGKRLYREVRDDEVTTMAAAFAYHWVFAIPSLLILVVVVAALLNRATAVPVVERLRALIGDHAPADTQAVLNRLVDNAVAQVGGGAASLGLIGTVLLALWSGSNGIGALMKAFNRAYDVGEGRPFVTKKLVAVGLTVLLALFVNLAFALLVFGRRLGEWLAGWVGLGSLFDVLWGLLRWPAAVAAIGLLLALLYYLGPDVEQSFRWISPGSVVATLGWLLLVVGFGLYLRVASPGSAYGTLGSVIVLLFFLYLTGLVFLVGAEVNAVLQQRHDPATPWDLATNPRAEPEARAEARRRRARQQA